MQSRRSFLAAPAAFAFVDWPQWRGPNRDGSLPAEAVKPWPERLRQVWNVPVGEGHSSPVVVGKRVFQFSRAQDREVIAAYDLDTGKQIWKLAYAAPYTMNPSAMAHGKGPKATPIVSGGRVYTLGIEGMLTCWDSGTGVKVWGYDGKGSPTFGTASSPVIDGATLFTAIGPQTGGSLSAFDAVTGKIKWQWKEDGPAYASPVVVDAGGVRQVVTNSQSSLIGLTVGEGKLVWKLPLKTPYEQNSVTPLVIGDLIVYSGLSNPVTAIRPGPTPQKAWENNEVGMYMNSPVLASGVLWGFSHRNKGQFFGLDPKTGKTLWTGEGRQAENAALIGRGDMLFALTTNSELQLFRTTPKSLQLVRTYQVADTPTWAHPALIGSRVLVKDANSLALWSGE
jgi:outer membrane protein assembly factor BamB